MFLTRKSIQSSPDPRPIFQEGEWQMKSTYMAVMVAKKSDSDISFHRVFDGESATKLLVEYGDRKLKRLFEFFEDGTTKEMTLEFKDGYLGIVPKKDSSV